MEPHGDSGVLKRFFLCLEGTHLAVINESRFSFLFCAKTKKNSEEKKTVRKCREETRWPNFQSHQKNSQTVFRQSDSCIFLRFLSHARMHGTNAISHLLHTTHATNVISHATNAIYAISHAVDCCSPQSMPSLSAIYNHVLVAHVVVAHVVVCRRRHRNDCHFCFLVDCCM